MANDRKRVLVTGAEGLIGGIVRERLANRYELTHLTREPAEFPSHVADIGDLAAIQPAFEGVDAVIHLAASAGVDAPWEDVLHNNIVGTRNVYEAAHRAGASQVVLASSNHAVGMYEIEGAPTIYDPDDPRSYDHLAEPRPDSLYGVSKLFGENLGRYYADLKGLRVVCLRIGAVRKNDDRSPPANLEAAPWHGLSEPDRHRRMAAVWLSQRDCAQLIARALDTDDVRFAVVYGVSDNPGRFWDLQHAREVLGFEPEDSAPA
jgi:nucleoside-diphosphate-sugar epimerase